MSRLLQTPFLPSVSLPTKTRSSVTGFRVKPRIIPIQAKIREIFMPALSSTMTEGKIVSWVKSEGDKLNKGESVVVVESDKADMDVETFYDGYLAAIMVEEGGVAPVGSAIALLAETEDEIADAKAKASGGGGGGDSKAPPASPPTAAVEAPVSVEKKVAAAPVSIKAVAASAVHPASEGGKRIVASPYAKKLAKELKVELAGLVGSGPMGRIVAKDVEAVAAGGGVQAAVAVKEVVAAPGVELGSVVPFTTMQGAVSRNMVESLGVPTFRVGYTISTDALDALYKKIKSKGVTMTALLAKATALALAKHPVVNSSCRDGNSFVYNSSINVAVAVAIDGGLITPVLQNADKVDIYSLSRKWKELVDKARAKQLQPQEYNTGTFTLSNLGMFGVDRFDAILPPGTGAIMAVGASQPSVVATKDGRIGMKNQMQVNVTADHRVIYGADLAQFLQTLASIIEDPKDLTF
ncbi:Dihydrolipoyllysine-residue acetyltransferase component 5 of pyruvate dehydrogenase complex [Arabidopsis thaliana]|uniref:Dihydrolipoyllysine-residue acetyltransferase component 5 of pyruvate dehydrogenase complex, chloroplastic n=3 Tax=Arabidopsis TaxID=3701 RepID=ODP25_ARATH|nr:2-oxoacid dehydrogenases acyltransferase family protein [Arabidopsis thaliana]Q9C8P0.1 RecName: Full=Dihydrolipoyllysine-residue acetyltransferase component 5 of pyruvate dehydrogenase complex, chloroplastic; AltName: Full=Dihydrolipoamide S-acetyltransferase component 5 of pyruvate dehydrogenase complex; AltName: Full=Protein EMBRYO DEFECTIVE 3003; AltName: Full=Pyruvate dehydrogenase complex component E2 5; Short=PDC-E2 5; Short=PDCE2 5; Flags: Precursor [Arabidopsis thaliana]KAG7648458.1 2-|eukprot:NP_174703.1 2-oxoacid dehydrogenases acyltransferase family protein [Arabidopsis thaliana]